MDVMAAAAAREAAGHRVIHMEVGQPATPAPKLARAAVIAALETQALGYTMALGNAALRARLRPDFPWLDETPPPRIPTGEKILDWARLIGFVLLAVAVIALPAVIAWLILPWPWVLIGSVLLSLVFARGLAGDARAAPNAQPATFPHLSGRSRPKRVLFSQSRSGRDR